MVVAVVVTMMPSRRDPLRSESELRLRAHALWRRRMTTRTLWTMTMMAMLLLHARAVPQPVGMTTMTTTTRRRWQPRPRWHVGGGGDADAQPRRRAGGAGGEVRWRRCQRAGPSRRRAVGAARQRLRAGGWTPWIWRRMTTWLRSTKKTGAAAAGGGWLCRRTVSRARPGQQPHPRSIRSRVRPLRRREWRRKRTTWTMTWMTSTTPTAKTTTRRSGRSRLRRTARGVRPPGGRKSAESERDFILLS
mmetsp:Transcript_36560/g.91140  ORF Transcript_36560/g.91140 Transcript_36560/m.91140 type:complete len:247 (-) Transcript_36560:367-1107(-)